MYRTEESRKIGEYIGKMYLEIKGRPRYIIDRRTNEEEKK